MLNNPSHERERRAATSGSRVKFGVKLRKVVDAFIVDADAVAALAVHSWIPSLRHRFHRSRAIASPITTSQCQPARRLPALGRAWQRRRRLRRTPALLISFFE